MKRVRLKTNGAQTAYKRRTDGGMMMTINEEKRAASVKAAALDCGHASNKRKTYSAALWPDAPCTKLTQCFNLQHREQA